MWIGEKISFLLYINGFTGRTVWIVFHYFTKNFNDGYHGSFLLDLFRLFSTSFKQDADIFKLFHKVWVNRKVVFYLFVGVYNSGVVLPS